MTYVAHWWSMDGARLAYLTINNSATPVMEIPHFLGGLYPSNVFFPYPKVKTSSNKTNAVSQFYTTYSVRLHAHKYSGFDRILDMALT